MKNEDQWQKREDEIYKAEREKLQEVEKKRANLKDRSIAGPHAPRPTDEYIDKSLGKPLSEREISQKAAQKTEKTIAQEKAQEERREREAVKKMAQDEKPRRKLSEQTKKIEFKRKQGRTR